MQFFAPALALTREPIPSEAVARATGEDQVRHALMQAAAARAMVHGRITASGCQRDDALLQGEQETVDRTEREISLASLDLERLNLLEARLRQRLLSLADTQPQEPAQ